MKKSGLLILASAFSLILSGCDTENVGELSNHEIILTEDGSWGYTGHHAVIEGDHLFYSYLDREGHTWVASYHMETGKTERTNIWTGDSNLHSSNPLFIRPDGRIQVFLDEGAYVDNKIRWRVSERPGDISEFGDLHTTELEADMVQGRQFYPVVHEPSGTVLLVLNAIHENSDRTAVMWKSDDGGDSFHEFYELWALGRNLESNRAYTRIYAEDNGIHFATVSVGWNEAVGEHDIGRVEGIYYTRYDVEQEAFFHADGTRSFGLHDLPVYEAGRFDTVWHWEDDGDRIKRALWSDIVADEAGRPYIAFAVQEAVPQGVSNLHDGHWATPDETGNWSHHKVATLARGWDNTPERKNYGIAIDPLDPLTVFVARSTNKDLDLSQVQKLRSSDRGETWDVTDILSEESRVTTVVIPRIASSGSRSVDVLWLEGLMEGWGEYGTKIKAVSNLP